MTILPARISLALLGAVGAGALAAQDAAPIVTGDVGEVSVRNFEKKPVSTSHPKPRDPAAGVTLKSIDVSADIQGLMARTTTTYVFENSTDLPVECQFSFPLPEHAAVDRFAMTVNPANPAELLEGTAVYTGDAEAIYQDLLDGNDGTCTAKYKLPGKLTLMADLGGRYGGGGYIHPVSKTPTNNVALIAHSTHMDLLGPEPVYSTPGKNNPMMVVDRLGAHFETQHPIGPVSAFDVLSLSSPPQTPSSSPGQNYLFKGATYQVNGGAIQSLASAYASNDVQPRVIPVNAAQLGHSSKKDPGVLQLIGPDLYRVTIYAVEAHKSKTLVVSCVHPLTVVPRANAGSEAVYRMPFAGLGELVPAPQVNLHSVLRQTADDSVVITPRDSRVNRKGMDVFVVTDVQKPSDHMDWQLSIASPAADALTSAGCTVQACRPDQHAPGVFAISLLPDAIGAESRQALPLDVVFVVDTSLPLTPQRRAARVEFIKAALQGLSLQDRFTLVTAGVDCAGLSDEPLEVTGANVESALCMLEGLEAASSTGNLNAAAAFDAAAKLCRPRLDRQAKVVFVGGALSVDADFSTLQAHIQAALNSVNAELLAVHFEPQRSGDAVLTDVRESRRLAQLSGGPVAELVAGANARDAGTDFARQLHLPILRDARLSLTGPDGKPLPLANPIDGGLVLERSSVFYGSYTTAGACRAILTGTVNGTAYSREWTLELPVLEKNGTVLEKLCARAQLPLALGATEPNILQYLSAIKHQVVHRNVSFLVLDSEDRYRKLAIDRAAGGAATLNPDVAAATPVNSPAKPELDVIGLRDGR